MTTETRVLLLMEVKVSKDKKKKAEKKPEPKAVKPKLDIEKKADAIRKSKMPEDQKRAYLVQLGVEKADGVKSKAISLKIYLAKKGIDSGLLAAYQAYPLAKNISLATPSEWDEIFKKF